MVDGFPGLPTSARWSTIPSRLVYQRQQTGLPTPVSVSRRKGNEAKAGKKETPHRLTAAGSHVDSLNLLNLLRVLKNQFIIGELDIKSMYYQPGFCVKFGLTPISSVGIGDK